MYFCGGLCYTQGMVRLRFGYKQHTKTKLKWWQYYIPLPGVKGTLCFPPRRVWILGYRDDMLAWETLDKKGRIWYFTDEKL